MFHWVPFIYRFNCSNHVLKSCFTINLIMKQFLDACIYTWSLHLFHFQSVQLVISKQETDNKIISSFLKIMELLDYVMVVFPLKWMWRWESKQNDNRIGGVMINMLSSSAVDRGLEPRSGQTKDDKIGIYCFTAMQQH